MNIREMSHRDPETQCCSLFSSVSSTSYILVSKTHYFVWILKCSSESTEKFPKLKFSDDRVDGSVLLW